MTDKRIKMECPFCHTPAKQIQLITICKGYYEIFCPKCNCMFRGNNKQEIINRWNCR